MSWQPPPEPELVPENTGAKAFYTKPAFLAPITMVGILVIGIWLFVSVINSAPTPTSKSSINYSGMAEVLDVGSTPSKCIAHVKRDDGRETRQDMRKSDCGKFQKGDIIKMENGQYVSTSPLPAVPVR